MWTVTWSSIVGVEGLNLTSSWKSVHILEDERAITIVTFPFHMFFVFSIELAHGYGANDALRTLWSSSQWSVENKIDPINTFQMLNNSIASLIPISKINSNSQPLLHSCNGWSKCQPLTFLPLEWINITPHAQYGLVGNSRQWSNRQSFSNAWHKCIYERLSKQ